MNYIRQPFKKCCGQTCVAMLTGLDVQEVCKLFHTRSGLSPEKLESMLRQLGFWVGEETLIGVCPMPPLALIYIGFKKKVGSGECKDGHVAVWHYGTIYDPSYGIQPDYPADIVLKCYVELHPPVNG